ncbi:MAG: E3 binding domain-containing protein, partial [Treponema sp.]|nr:E3 binding domain-containing protein [Treponema sp.]
MAHVLIMPRQGNTVESCIIQEWKVKEGDAVKSDTSVCIVETDKATFDVPAGADGIILKLLHNAGDDVPVLKPIAVVGAAGEDWQTVLGGSSQETSRRDTETQSTSSEDASRRDAEAQSTSSQDASRRDAEAQSTSSQDASRRDAEAQREEKENLNEPDSKNLGAFAPLRETNDENAMSPRAKNLAAKERISAAVPGTGPGGRIIERDIKAALANRAPLTAAAKPAAAG